MLVTSDGANKILKQIEERKSILMDEMNTLSTYVAAVTENPKNARPDFDFKKVVEELANLDEKIIKIKSAKTKFNNETEITVGDEIMTIGEVLVRMPILNKYVELYKKLSTNQEKSRVPDAFGRKNVIEYKYVNYDLKDASDEYCKAQKKLVTLQQALNIVNVTGTFEIDVEM